MTSTDLDVLYENPLPSTMTRDELVALIEMDDDLDVMGASSDEELIQHSKSTIFVA